MGVENLRRQLAVAVRSIQWSYAIFWSLSTKQQGVLEWKDGYYNGDIKTMKTLQAMELKHDKIGLQRSEQLRELYNALLEEETEQQTKRPVAALSPEDLSDAEWYYLVCMSFVFTPGQSLPGKALANKETIWLCDAEYADNKVFSRSLLAKTVICFPHLDGVIEMGVTEPVPEDPNLVQHIKASLLDFSKPVCYAKSSPTEDDDKDPACALVNCHNPVDALENLYTPMEDVILEQHRIDEFSGNMDEDLNMDSHDDYSNGCEQNNETEEFLNQGASNVQNWQFMDDEISNGFLDSVNSSDCTSETLVNEELRAENNTKLSSVDLEENDDLHYRKTLSLVLGSSTQLITSSCFCCSSYKSSFITWKNEKLDVKQPKVQQNILKKILFTVPLMHGSCSLRLLQKENRGKDCTRKLQNDEICEGKSDKQRENEQFLVLKSLIPTVGEIDKASILDDMIRYLNELKARVEELESCTDSVDDCTKPQKNYPEQISDNSDDNGKKLWINKRKASDIYKTDAEIRDEDDEDGFSSDVKVSMNETEVNIELKCRYREYILLDIMDEINNLHLDVVSVQSSTVDGMLSLTLKSKFRGAAVAPVRMIKQALRKIGCI
ncbi:basic helix-loop-helix (bHLH) DNA-binding superfamily protein [Euphorbia peplus]|nr:basic helix-loop-helix (bHLH) DNA-binding superfamily protein [Euphorbia peplus]